VIGEASSFDKPTKRTGPLIIGVILGLSFFIIIFFILNHFKILNFTLPFFPTNKNIVQFGSAISQPLQDKAKKAGYQIVWQGSSTDTTGRSVLLSKERVKTEQFPSDQFGYLNDHTSFIGLVKEFEKIEKSNDYYLVINDPVIGWDIKTRLTAKKVAPGNNTTKFAIDNLSNAISSNSANSCFENLFDYTGTTPNREKIQKIIKPGDVVHVFFKAVLKFENGIVKDTLITKDENGVGYADFVILRRFNGKDQIYKEF
jgi:hypothetical protein